VKVQDDTAEFLARMRELDISFRLENSGLRVCAPKHVLTPELRAQLASRKADILTFLSETVSAPWSEAASIDRVPRDGSLPLSFAQSRLWFLEQLMPGSTAYTLPMYSRLRGPLDIDALKKSFFEVTRRHEILRTIFPVVDGSPNQVILPPSLNVMPVVDLSGMPPEEREVKALGIAVAEAKQPFDLTKGPLIRAKLLRLAPEDHVLLFAVHHIVFDGWSIDVFWQDLSTLYCALRSGKPSPLPDLPFQYVDFASWQKRSLEGPVREVHLAYWKQQLGEHPPTLDLPTDRPREYSPHSPGAKKTLQLGSALCASLKSLSQREGASLSMTLLAAFNVLLHRLAGQDDILVGMPVACRNRAEFERMVGIFVNTMVVRTRFSELLTFRDVLHQVRDTMLDAHEHQDMPFEELVGALDPQRDLHRTPLFQVFFNHLNMQLTPSQIPGLQVEPFGEFEVESKFDFTLYLHERNDSISLLLVYNTRLFDDGRMTALLEQYARLLEQVCDDPLRPVDECSLLTESPGRNSPVPDAAAPLEDRWLGLVHSRFLQRSVETPRRVAVVDQNAEWSYGQMASLSSGLSGWLRSRVVGPGDTVAVYGHRSAPLVLALLGILRAGAAFCILDPAYPSLGLAKRLRIVRPKAWLQVAAAGPPPEDLQAAIAETSGDCRLTLPETPEASFPEHSSRSDSSLQDETDRPAYVTFTSGTTGEPKCIVGTHGPLSHFLDWHVGQFGLTNTDRFSMLSGLAHDPLLRDIFTPLWIGATLLIPKPEDILSPGRLSEWMEQQQVTVAHLTPAMGALLSQPSGTRRKALRPLSKLRYAFFGGDALSSQDVALITGIAPQVRCISFYGATETPQAMAWCDSGGRAAGSHSSGSDDFAVFSGQIPIGNPIADVQILILNHAGALAGVGELGEIHIRTPHLSQGYANDEILTRERFPTNPFTQERSDRLYRTGDLGRYRPDGLVEFAGRADTQIKIRGYRVELREVEAALLKHANILECAVVVEESLTETKKLVAYFVTQDKDQLNLENLRAHLGRLLPDYQIPSEFHALSSMPLTPNGKIDLRILASRKFRLPLLKRLTPPRNQIEASMVEIWKKVLGVETVGVFDNFFEMGGHSLAATRLIAQLQSAFQIDIPLQALFLEPTIAGMAEHVQHDAISGKYHYESTIPRWKCVVAAQPKGTRTPFFFAAGYQNKDDTLLVLSRFIPHLGSDQPVFGLRPRWIDGAGGAYASVEEAAEEFLAELREIQPKGPYLLGGHCVGGIIAFEMARQLIETGEKVNLLALLDVERPTACRAALADLRLMSRRAAHMADVLAQMVRARGAARKTIIRDVFHRRFRAKQPEQAAASVDNGFYENKVGYRRLAYKHTVKEYPGRITLFVNDLQYRFDKHMGWKGIAREGLSVHRVPGDHGTILSVHGKEFAKLLLACLDEATAKPGLPTAEAIEVLS
jgi:amino acid adenylation domain-containing protein